MNTDLNKMIAGMTYEINQCADGVEKHYFAIGDNFMTISIKHGAGTIYGESNGLEITGAIKFKPLAKTVPAGYRRLEAGEEILTTDLMVDEYDNKYYEVSQIIGFPEYPEPVTPEEAATNTFITQLFCRKS